MPHYKDGTEAKVGDLIKGVGYNIKDQGQKPKVIVGTLVRITPNSESCNLVLLTVQTERLDKNSPDFAWQVNKAHRLFNNFPGGIVDNTKPCDEMYSVNTQEEYGALKDFELVHRPE